MPSREQDTEEVGREKPPFDCPFDDCEWTSEILKDGPDPTFDEYDDHLHEERARRHYSEEHAGRVRVRVTLEMEQELGDRDPHDIADRYHDKFDERDDLFGWDVAYAVAEVVDESDPHPESDRDE